VPEEFSSNSDTLKELQAEAIAAHAVYGVEVDTSVSVATWAARVPPMPCLYINFHRRKDFTSLSFLPLSLVKRNGRVVAGVCVTSLRQCRELDQRPKTFPSSLDRNLESFLEGYVYVACALEFLLIVSGSS
jgi:hypothetical protein